MNFNLKLQGYSPPTEVWKAFEEGAKLLNDNQFELRIDLRQPGYIRATVNRKKQITKVEWAHESSWRFMPIIKHKDCGYILHPIDLATNKVLTLAGRNEPRDFIDVLYLHSKVLSLGALTWASAGKDPGFNPRSLLELLRRRGRIREEEIKRLHIAKPLSAENYKTQWLEALDLAEEFIESRHTSEVGALYHSLKENRFYTPTKTDEPNVDYLLHYGKPGGILPSIVP